MKLVSGDGYMAVGTRWVKPSLKNSMMRSRRMG